MADGIEWQPRDGSTTISVRKIDAARTQLRTAIRLWFAGDDPISAHALAFAAYEVIHAVSKKRDKFRRDLLFDSDLIKDEYRSDWNIRLKKEAYFFKHGDRDPEGTLDFNPEVTSAFILFALLGRELAGEAASDEENAFIWWHHIHKPSMLTEHGRSFVAKNLPRESLEQAKLIPKCEFWNVWKEVRVRQQIEKDHTD